MLVSSSVLKSLCTIPYKISFPSVLINSISGVWRDRMWPDGWTAVTADGKRSAQFEHTLLVLFYYTSFLVSERLMVALSWMLSQIELRYLA